MQNKVADASPIREQTRKTKLSFDTNPYTPWRTVRSAKQENERKRLKRTWDFVDNERPSWTDPVKATRKARLSIRHKSLYAMKNGLSYKTRKRAEDQWGMNRSKSITCNMLRPEYKTECGTVLTSVADEVRRTGLCWIFITWDTGSVSIRITKRRSLTVVVLIRKGRLWKRVWGNRRN